jgi:large subunit ribosomal protein L15
LDRIEALFNAGDEVSAQSLIAHDLLQVRGQAKPIVKIVGGGQLTKKLTFKGCLVTGSVRQAIEKAGGSIV